MPEWMTIDAAGDLAPSISVLAIRLVLAWCCGWIVALLARRKQPVGSADTLTLTLVLMSVLIAMATQIIGDNIARAFSLVGALSIVRFRTAVPAPRDVAFVLAAVVVGMAIGAGQYWVVGLGLVVVALATQFNAPPVVDESTDRFFSASPPTWRITIQIGLNSTGRWQAELERVSERLQLTSAETARRGGAIELVYRLTPNNQVSAVDLLASLNLVQGVESVAVKID